MALYTALSYLLLLSSQAAAEQSLSPNLSPLALGFFTTPETQKPVVLDIHGSIPTWISGSLYRGAQAGWNGGNYTSEHWFDGFSRNHRFEISNGKVEYRSRNASDELHDFVAETGRFPGGSFGGDPCKVILGAFEITYRDGISPVGNTTAECVDVSYVANFPGLGANSSSRGPFITLVSTTDANSLQQIDPVTLDPIELFNYQAESLELGEGGQSAAHPAHTSTGELYNYVLNGTSIPPEYKVFRISNKGVVNILARITDAPAAYIHSVFDTENYIILIVWQADIGTPAAPTYNLLDTLKPWDSHRETIYCMSPLSPFPSPIKSLTRELDVVDKAKGGVVAKYTSETFFAFHQVCYHNVPWLLGHLC